MTTRNSKRVRTSTPPLSVKDILMTHSHATTELQEIVQAREKLEAQQQENKSVQKVRKKLHSIIYSLIGLST